MMTNDDEILWYEIPDPIVVERYVMRPRKEPDPPTSALPAGTYRVINGELYRVEPGLPLKWAEPTHKAHELHRRRDYLHLQAYCDELADKYIKARAEAIGQRERAKNNELAHKAEIERFEMITDALASSVADHRTGWEKAEEEIEQLKARIVELEGSVKQ